MSELEQGIAEHLRQEQLRGRHRSSGLWDDTLLDRYATRGDFVAFMDETHRSTTTGDVAYYGLSAVVFHADDLPEIRRDLESIAGGNFWHSKEAFKDQRLRGRIAEMNEYIADRAALPAIIFDVRDHDISDVEERGARDVCLGRALRVLNEEGIRDVVLDQFAHIERHNVPLDQAILSGLRAAGTVDPAMWMHHARMSEEHALWSADAVAWSVQRHYFGQQDRDSQHVAPLRGHLREVHAQTGTPRQFEGAVPVAAARPDGRRERTAPIHRLARQIDRLRGGSPSAGATPPAAGPDTPKAPPTWRPEGPSRSL